MASSSKLRGWLWRWGPVVVWMAALFWASALATRPPTPGLERLSWDDKLQHTAAYAILAALAWRALGSGFGGSRHANLRCWLRVAVAVLIAVGYGAFDECHQLFVPCRQCSLADLSADSAGAALAGIVLGMLDRKTGGDGLGGERERREDV